MATWKVEPTYKKSVIEIEHWSNNKGESFTYETGWRWGTFLVYTDDDNPPDIQAGVNIYDCGYEMELVECWDGCWSDYDYDECSDETREFLEEFMEDHSPYELEGLNDDGWSNDETEMIIDCDLQITKVNEDGTEDEPFTTSSEKTEESEAPKLHPNAWPFPTASEE